MNLNLTLINLKQFHERNHFIIFTLDSNKQDVNYVLVPEHLLQLFS